MSVRVLARTVLDDSAEEVLLTIGDGKYSCDAYCQPCSVEVGYILNSPLIAFETGSIERQSSDASVGFSTGASPFGWLVCAEVADLVTSLVRVGEIQMEVDRPLPGDVLDGEVVSFSCARLDFTS